MFSLPHRAAAAWIGAFVGAGAVLIHLYPDSYQQDGGYHFLFARWAASHPELFVDVWSRPAFTALYWLPAQLGYPAAKLFTLALCAVCAWQTWRLALQLNLARPVLAIPLLVLQPSFFLISIETMTEPVFALNLVVALRLHYSGRRLAGALVASLLILARPEAGLVLGVWALWLLSDRREPALRKVLVLPALAAGAAIWWVAALAITGDPLFIPKSWPRNWSAVDALYGSGPTLGYAARIPEMAGPLLAIPCILGAVLAFRRGPRAPAVLVTAVFAMHSVLWWIGGFGTAGYPRYMVTVSPAIAILSLIGWNAMADRMSMRPSLRPAGAAVVLGISALFSVFYVDCWTAPRDARAIEDAHAAWLRDPRPVTRFVWSHAYMAIRFDDDPKKAPKWGDRTQSLQRIAELPPGTLVFWDAHIGPNWFHIFDADFQRAGFERRVSRSYGLGGLIGGPQIRRQEMHLLYKP
jgi:hypothetical protein